MNAGKNASARKISGGRATTRPTASALETDSARARGLGVQPSSRGDLEDPLRGSPARGPGRSFSAKETAPFDTPAALATSLIVGRGILRLNRFRSRVSRVTPFLGFAVKCLRWGQSKGIVLE